MIGNLPETKWRGFCLRNPQGNPQKSAEIRRNPQKSAETPYQKPLSKTPSKNGVSLSRRNKLKNGK